MQLNSANVLTNFALRDAMGALFHLDQLGATVLDVTITGRNPRIRIDPGKAFLPGAIKRRVSERGEQRVVMATHVLGCQVEWEERYREPTQAHA
jgi:hypothetical protein